MLSAKQGSHWYHFYNVFGMTRPGIDPSPILTYRTRSGRSTTWAIAAEYADNQSIICLVVCSTHGHDVCLSSTLWHSQWDANVWNEDASMISWCSLVDASLYWWSEGHAEHIFVGVEDNYCCICQFLLIRSIHPKPGSLCQTLAFKSSRMISLLLGCCRNNTIHSIIELSLTSSAWSS